ncbi:MAG: nucleotidyltransferase family protein [Cloacibacillus sp.]
MFFPAVGIVAEYNPLHKGHLYHINEARRISSAECAVAVLSSDFVQRGEPALLDKWTRAEAALSCGCDLVLELPVLWSSHNAGVFSNGAVDLLAATGVVSSLAFGAETPDCLTDSIIDILLEEPEPFKLSLKKHLDEGFSFVEARARAADELLPGSARIFSGSNNTLALSYMTRIRQKNYEMAALPIKRVGAAYTSAELEEVSSATAIRKAIKEGRTEEAIGAMPEASASILRGAMLDGRACTDSAVLWKLLRAALLRASAEELRQTAEISEGIEYKMKELALESESFEQWVDGCTSKRYTAGRIRRYAIHVLLGLGHWTNRAAQRLGPPYIRVLGMNSAGRKLLRKMRGKSTLPIAVTCGQAARASAYAAEAARVDLLAAELWEELIPGGRLGGEHKRKIIMA